MARSRPSQLEEDQKCRKKILGEVASPIGPIPGSKVEGACQEETVSANGKGHEGSEVEIRGDGKAYLTFTTRLGGSGLPEENTLG